MAHTKGILDVEPLLLKQLFWVGTPVLQAVEPQEPWVVQLRERIRNCIRASVAPLTEYTKHYEQVTFVPHTHTHTQKGKKRGKGDICWLSIVRAHVSCWLITVVKQFSCLVVSSQFQDLINLNVDKYLKEFEEQERDAADIKTECQMHMKEQQRILTLIPSSIDIGLFHLSCDNVRRQVG